MRDAERKFREEPTGANGTALQRARCRAGQHGMRIKGKWIAFPWTKEQVCASCGEVVGTMHEMFSPGIADCC